MIASEVLADLRHQGVELFVAGDQLRWRAPRGVMTPELRATLSAHKAELRAMLAAPKEELGPDAFDCVALLQQAHADIRAAYVHGALPWALANQPDLARRFRETEDRIDTLAKIGPIEADFRAALTEHAAVWAEICGRYRAHQEQQAERPDPMPELPANTAAAIGVSYGDGKPGTWDVVRRTR